MSPSSLQAGVQSTDLGRHARNGLRLWPALGIAVMFAYGQHAAYGGPENSPHEAASAGESPHNIREHRMIVAFAPDTAVDQHIRIVSQTGHERTKDNEGELQRLASAVLRVPVRVVSITSGRELILTLDLDVMTAEVARDLSAILHAEVAPDTFSRSPGQPFTAISIRIEPAPRQPAKSHPSCEEVAGALLGKLNQAALEPERFVKVLSPDPLCVLAIDDARISAAAARRAQREGLVSYYQMDSTLTHDR